MTRLCHHLFTRSTGANLPNREATLLYRSANYRIPKGCLKRGQECQYGSCLLWEDEGKSMGIAFGRSGMKDRFMKTKIKSTVEHCFLPVKSHASRYWLTTTPDDIRLLYEGCPDTRPVIQIYDLLRNECRIYCPEGHPSPNSVVQTYRY